jgi:UDPglucose--hexose-1-phosphate uridylyltransferase
MGEDSFRELGKSPHRRFNPLTGEWVLVSPQRTQRPWQGQVERPPERTLLRYDPTCYLCPGNRRAGSAQNPAYTSTFVFENDFAALRADTPAHAFQDERGFITARSERGVCKVVCFSPRHDLTLGQMTPEDIGQVVDVWAQEYLSLGALPFIHHVQIFENRGEMMGCSNPHPHGQIWANETVPSEPLKEQKAFLAYRERNGSCLLCDYAAYEIAQRERMVAENDDFIACVPFWAIWPFELLVTSKRHFTDIAGLNSGGRAALADILRRVAQGYDHLFQVTFPYSMGFHQRPTDGEEHGEWHFHAHFYPPLLRSATVRKFMVGYEMLASPQRDITPESAAERLREVQTRAASPAPGAGN